MLNEAPFVNLLVVRVLRWSQITAGRRRRPLLSRTSSFRHGRPHQQAALTKQFQHTLTLTLRHHTSWTHAHLSQLSAVLSPFKKMIQHVAGITLPINSNRLHIIHPHTLLNPIVPDIWKTQLPHFSVAQCSQPCCPVTSASQRRGRCITATSVSNSKLSLASFSLRVGFCFSTV